MDKRTTLNLILAIASLAIGVVEAPAASSNLLISDHGGHYWFRHCENQPDDTPLPPDPRSLVTPTYDKAVAFNVSWHACLNRQPATCGELRALAAAGGRLLGGNGDPGAGWQFSGHQAQSTWSITANQYNALWLRWGLLGRPADFDQLVAERYGMPLSAQRNPYPLPKDRKIYNTRMHSQSNSGHEFTDVLTDAERTALIEYLKTL